MSTLPERSRFPLRSATQAAAPQAEGISPSPPLPECLAATDAAATRAASETRHTRPASHRIALIQAVRRHGPLLSRIVAAIFGGYALAALGSVATLALPISRTEAVISGALLSFLIYAGAVIWVFAVASATRAWAGLSAAALPLLIAAGTVWWGAGAV